LISKPSCFFFEKEVKIFVTPPLPFQESVRLNSD